MRSGPATPSRTPRVGSAVLQCAGLVTMVLGTFLPWLRSGSVDRNSYAADGVARQILRLSAVVDFLLSIWPFLSLLAAAAVALLVIGRVAIGAAVAVLCALAGGGVAIAVLLAASGFLVRPASTGPAVTLAGASLVLATVIVHSLVTVILRRRAGRDDSQLHPRIQQDISRLPSGDGPAHPPIGRAR